MRLQIAKITAETTKFRRLYPSLPLNHFGRRFVVDLQAQIYNSDGQIPTVHPPHFFGLEFTEKFLPLELLAISLPIGVNRLNSAARVAGSYFLALARRSSKYRQRSGKRWFGRSVVRRTAHYCTPAMRVRFAPEAVSRETRGNLKPLLGSFD